jgi:hypothetical protein
VLAGFSIPLALQLKAHHKLALVLSRNRGKNKFIPVFDQKRWSEARKRESV